MKKLLLLLICFVFLINTKVYADDVKCDMGEFYWKYKDSAYEGMVVYENGYDLLSIYITDASHYLLLSESNFSYYFSELAHGHGDLSQENMILSTSVFYTNNIGGTTLPWYCYQGGFTGVVKSRLSSYICDKEYVSYADMLNDMSNYESFIDYKNAVYKEIGKGQDDEDNFLPGLSLSFSKKWYSQLANDFWRYSLITNWDYKEKEPYVSAPDKYKIQIIAFLNGYNSTYQSLSDVNTWYWVTKGQSVAANEYKFSLEETVNNIRNKFNYPVVTENVLLNVFIRTYDPASGKVSKWSSIVVEDPCGAPIIKPSVFPEDADNSIDTDIDPPIDNGGYESGGEDDSRSDPNSDNYVDPSELDGIEAIIANLKSLAIAVGTIPSLLNDVYMWLPSDLIVLISSSIGLVILIGVIKWAR